MLVNIHGVPAYKVVDSSSDVTIMGGELLWRVDAVAKLRKKDSKPPDKIPLNYDQQPFKLNGQMDLAVSFAGRVLTTPIYIEMDTEEPLLLSEGVCDQLDIVEYHHVCVCPLKDRRKAMLTVDDQQSVEVKMRGCTRL